MGASLSSRQVPQVRLLAALLETHHVKVSLRQLQRYWDLLLPFNPWLVTCALWSPETYERLIQRVTSAMERDQPPVPSWPVPGSDVATPPSWPEARSDVRREVTVPPSWPIRNTVAAAPSWPAPGGTANASPPWPASPPACPSNSGSVVNPPPPAYDTAFLTPPTPPLAQMFPLNPARTPQNPQAWIPFSPKDIQMLRNAIEEDGLASPHAQDILERMAIPRCIPYDWISLARAVLSPRQFIDWRAHLGVLIDNQIADNARQGVHYPANAFLGLGPYGDPSAYTATPGFFIQLRDCVFKAFRSCAAAAPEPLAKLFQKPDEPFNEFVARVQGAAERRVTGAAAKESFVKDLLQEGANPACKAIIRPLHDRPLQDWVLACSGVSGQTTALAAALVAAVQTTNTCFRCDDTSSCPVEPA
ncbi:endogenous retrovirus group K member 24 Gag polyprotein-like [Dasypus novemcinctus]|uniref:endogenous retrovirus group K member 24 Gag polyprotein-like n=2 Tax=Dasypus novemcinctus TaxID=9361 RepID=UPI0039C954D4